MNIAIDARILDVRMTGISRFLWNIIKYLPEYDTINKYFLFTSEGFSYQSDFYNIIVVKNSRLPKQIYSHYWLNFILPKHLENLGIDIFFTPYILVPLKSGNHKNVIVIHDSMPKACKQYYTFHYRNYLRLILPPAIKRSDKVLTVSQSAKNDLIKYNHISPDKIEFMYLWTDENYKSRELTEDKKNQLLNKYSLPERFILFVGAIEERKNVEGIITISDMLYSSGVEIKVVLIGSKGFGFKNIYSEIQKREERIIYLNYIAEDDLPFIYNLSTLFLFPSHYEGFGLPPLEALKSGIPVLSSNNSSLNEVVGKGGLTCNSTDYQCFVDNITSLLSNTELYSDYKRRAIEQAEKFTPEKQIPKLISIFNELS